MEQLRQLVEQQQRALLAIQNGRMSARSQARPELLARLRRQMRTPIPEQLAPRQAAASASNVAATPDQASPEAGWDGNRFSCVARTAVSSQKSSASQLDSMAINQATIRPTLS